MRWFKFIMTVIVLLLVYLFVHQNYSHFIHSFEFKFAVPFMKEESTLVWSHSLTVVILIFTALGYIAGFITMFIPWNRKRRLANEYKKQLKQPVDLQRKETPDISISPEAEAVQRVQEEESIEMLKKDVPASPDSSQEESSSEDREEDVEAKK